MGAERWRVNKGAISSSASPKLIAEKWGLTYLASNEWSGPKVLGYSGLYIFETLKSLSGL